MSEKIEEDQTGSGEIGSNVVDGDEEEAHQQEEE